MQNLIWRKCVQGEAVDFDIFINKQNFAILRIKMEILLGKYFKRQ